MIELSPGYNFDFVLSLAQFWVKFQSLKGVLVQFWIADWNKPCLMVSCRKMSKSCTILGMLKTESDNNKVPTAIPKSDR